MNPTTQRWIGLAGILAMAGGTVPFVLVPSAPANDAAAAQIVAFYSTHPAELWATWVSAIAVVPSVVFLAGLVELMRHQERGAGWVWLAILMGAVGIVAAAMAEALLGALLSESAATSDPSTVSVLLRLLNLTYIAQFLAVVPFLGPIGWVASASRVLPTWLAYLAYLAAAVCAIASLGVFVESGPLAAGGAFAMVAFLAAGAWWILASIVLIVRPTRIAVVAAAGA